jgi:hypothetical protein
MAMRDEGTMMPRNPVQMAVFVILTRRSDELRFGEIRYSSPAVETKAHAVRLCPGDRERTA